MDGIVLRDQRCHKTAENDTAMTISQTRNFGASRQQRFSTEDPQQQRWQALALENMNEHETTEDLQRRHLHSCGLVRSSIERP